jgi:hypothetical protein
MLFITVMLIGLVSVSFRFRFAERFSKYMAALPGRRKRKGGEEVLADDGDGGGRLIGIRSGGGPAAASLDFYQSSCRIM